MNSRRVILGIILGLGYSIGALANSQVVCSVEDPCGWANEGDRGEPALGYCVGKVHGDKSEFTVMRSTATNGDLMPAVLKTKMFSKSLVQATDEKGHIQLDAELNRVGTLTIGKLGFFVFCEMQ